MSIFGDFEEILIYRDREWIKNPNKIEPMQGFWINSNQKTLLAFYGDGYNIDINSLNNGWSLVGGVVDMSNLKLGEIEEILLFKDKKWIKIDSFYDLENIKRASGFWILK